MLTEVYDAWLGVDKKLGCSVDSGSIYDCDVQKILGVLKLRIVTSPSAARGNVRISGAPRGLLPGNA